MTEFKIQVDGTGVTCREGVTVLRACLDAGIYIPNLCSHPQLKPAGACRLCVVEIEGVSGAVPACETIVREGMSVRTQSGLLQRLRRLAAELILSEHPEDCSSCPVFGKCELQSVLQYVGASNGRFRSAEKPVAPNLKNPLFVHDMYRCIKCGRCVRICRDVRGVGVMRFVRDSAGDRAVSCGAQLLTDTDCRFCGACVEVCPTGALRDAGDSTAGSLPRELALTPCRGSCPAHIDVPRYVRHVKNGEFDRAVETIREKAPFPAVLGYVCSRFCEADCRRGRLNGAVSIRELKRVAAEQGGDSWRAKFLPAPPTGKRAAVIGGGPAGLTAALELTRHGVETEVFETLPEAGGMLRYGIPEYRLPVQVLRREIGEILSLGVRLHTGQAAPPPDRLLEQGFDAVLVAAGAHQGSRLPIDGAELPGVLSAVEFLRSVRLGAPPVLRGTVAVLGGGNVAFDCARTAVRLGAERVRLFCLESEDAMPCDREELRDGRVEGIQVFPSRAFLSICGQQRVSGVSTAAVTSFELGRDGVLRLEYDQEHPILEPADTVIFAVGQKPEDPGRFGLELERGTYIKAGPSGAASRPGVFAAGDVVTGTRSVIEAIAAGARAAEGIAAYLGLPPYPRETAEPRRDPWLGVDPGFASLPREEPARPAGEGPCPAVPAPALDCASARREAGRCLQCDLRLDVTRQKFWSEYKKGEV